MDEVLKYGIILITLGIMLFTFNTACMADDNAITKFGNGLVNLLTGWLELPKQISDTYKKENSLSEALTTGTLKGVIYSVGRTAAGALDAAFFFLPPYDKPIMKPLYKVFATSTK
ncbi:MAG: exosortase system-associated protein, TIGR04073 family [Candidatus Omnitrophica bacterium]|nr:exosortase system-associated protein, TIGR04073 family [Candidatus Omnitrophota bacterium]